MRIMTNLDVNFNEISNAIVNGIIMKPLATAPTTAREGEFYYNSVKKQVFQYNGTEWIPMGGKIVGSEGDMIVVEVNEGVISATVVDGSITKEKLATGVQDALDNSASHIADTTIHVTSEDKANWADKYTKTETDDKVKEVSDAIDAHTENADIHVTTVEKAAWADKYTKTEIDGKIDTINGVTDGLQTQIANVNSSLEGHTGNADIHVTAEDKANWADKYTKTETDSAIAAAIANADHLKRAIVETLPTSDIDENTIYMIKKGSSETGDNYEEYMLIEGALVKIGDTTVDLTDYLTKTGDASDTTVTFTEAAEDKPELTTGDKISVLIGKIKKLFNSLHSVATSGDYNDLSNKIETLTDSQNAQEKTYTLSEDTEVTVYSVDLEMNGEKVIGDITYNTNGFTVKFSEIPESEVKVKALYTK